MSGGPVLDDQRALPLLLAGSISPTYRKPHTWRQHHTALTEGMTYRQPVSVSRCLVSLLLLAGARAAWAARPVADGAGERAVALSGNDRAVDWLRGYLAAGDVVLVKASREARLDEVAAALA